MVSIYVEFVIRNVLLLLHLQYNYGDIKTATVLVF